MRKTLLNDDVGLQGNVSTAQVSVDQIMKEVGNNSCAAVYRPEYAEWPKREISETSEKLHTREVNSKVEGGGLEAWSSFCY